MFNVRYIAFIINRIRMRIREEYKLAFPPVQSDYILNITEALNDARWTMYLRYLQVDLSRPILTVNYLNSELRRMIL